jgi:hypothetical protein
MSQAWAVVVAAVVTTLGSVTVAVMSKMRKENRDDHMTVMSLLRVVGRKQDRIEDKLDSLTDRFHGHLQDGH